MSNYFEYPKDYAENLRYRAKILVKARKDHKLQAALKEACRQDRLFLFNAFYYTYDPRTLDKSLPFITYPFQDEFIHWDLDCLQQGVDNFVDKSRDMGVTWMLICNDLAEWLFSEERVELQWGSRKEQYVDFRGDMKAIFPRFRFLLHKLPKWLLPAGFSFNQHDNYMRLINPETGSIIAGESTGAYFGHGDRKLRVRFDEFAFWEHDDSAWEGSADVTKCRTAISTPNGSGNKFAQLAKGNEIKQKRHLHWTLHPIKAKGAYIYKNDQKVPINPQQAVDYHAKGIEVRSPWYDVECERRSAQGVAQDLDISYLMSGRPFFDLYELNRQKVWEFTQRPHPLAIIPWGHYIKGNLVEQRGKVKFIERKDGWLRLFQKPEEGSEFVIGADTAEGLPKGDQCAAVVRDKWTRNVYATLFLNIAPEEFAPKLFLMSKFFYKQGREALIAAENNNHGYTTCKELDDMGANLWITPANENPHGQPKRGFTTTLKTRPLILDRMEEDIRKHAAELRCPILMNQCETFIHNETNGKPEADGDFFDDGVISCAIAGYAIDRKPYKARVTTNIRRRQMAYDKRKHKNAGAAF